MFQTSCSAHASPGTLRGDFALDIGRTATLEPVGWKRCGDDGREAGVGDVVHSSDSTESAERDLGIYFNKDELVDYGLVTAKWLTE